MYIFKLKNSKVVASVLCLGNTSKDWAVDDIKNTGFNGYIYDVSINYDAIAVDDILDIDKYLIKKNSMI